MRNNYIDSFVYVWMSIFENWDTDQQMRRNVKSQKFFELVNDFIPISVFSSDPRDVWFLSIYFWFEVPKELVLTWANTLGTMRKAKYVDVFHIVKFL